MYFQVHDHLHSIFKIKEADDEYTFVYDISMEIFDFRCLVRQSKYLAKPFQVEEHKTLSGKNLDHDLVNFMEKCKENRGQHLTKVVENDLATKQKLCPLFIFLSDRTDYFDVEKQTKTKIIDIINKELENIDVPSYNEKWKKIRDKNKTIILTFLKEIQDLKTV